MTRTARALAGALAGALLAATLVCSRPALAHEPIAVLFVGNSYTFGRADPVMSYNAANVHDLTAAFYAASPTGANPWEPHPWGGVPGIFKQLTAQVGLHYDVSISARNAASLRGQFLNTANAAWDLRGNVASRRWDVVVLQEQSDAALPVGKGKNANPATFVAYANQFERFIHDGAAQTYTETQLFGSLAACQATGLSTASCNTKRVIPQNTNASAATRVYLTETWARPDMVYAHKTTVADPNTPDGSPIPDGTGTDATLYYANLAGMTADLRAAFAGAAAANPGFAGVIPVGDAFQRAYDLGIVKTEDFYTADGVYAPPRHRDRMDLWWKDYLHASKYGSYLDALVQFGMITGIDPLWLGPWEKAARELDIAVNDALMLQWVASAELGVQRGRHRHGR